ncbi:hypothetical protein GCM10014715_22910 [Streptomyces spiralis]|uniref:DUF2961 domain-containing protein n=1 Tax=Streptomyces spiralis TaxID=66376 RepID=A0A918ZU12_9ACTN|nr:glycoside hydrolase family 172 protein [Streptomyces spiralis]GHE68610.1 hypothetical protein GCM10014715_22910 [Streptomyces spiralis]
MKAETWARRAAAVAVAVAAALTPGAATATAADAPVARHTAPGTHGPVGWDTYRHLDRLGELPSGVRTQQFSSFDRAGGNDDGFDGTYSCLRTTTEGCVIAEHSGPGEIGAIWFTRDGGDVSRTGTITIELDGKTVLHASLQDVVDGKLGAPFTAPLVADADASSGGVLIEVPMTFRRSMRITTEHNPLFYHVSYRTFADAVGVTTFDPSDPAQDVVDRLKAAGTRDPKPALPGARTTARTLDLAPGQTRTLAKVTDPGLLTALDIRLPQASYVTPRTETDNGRAFGAGGSSEFTVAVDPANEGVTLTRRLDPGIGHQVADVYVDGHLAGRWSPNEPVGGGLWAEQSVRLPASLTAGKSRITVKNVFVSSDLDYNEFTYWADSETGGQTHRTDTVDVGTPASEQDHAYRITAPTWQGERTFGYPLDDDQRARLAETQKLLQGLRLRISFDGHRTVDSPLGEFFGSGHALAPVRSLMFGIDPATRAFRAWWPMPFARSAEVQLYNGSGTAVTTGTAAVTSAPSTAHARAVQDGTEGYFRTQSHAGPTTDGQSWPFLVADGRGKFVGVSHTMTGETNRNYLEGDERVHVDGSRTPQLHGTGTEDFYQSGWYFNRETYTQPFNGNPTHLGASTGCAADRDCTGAYRLQIHDAVPFTRSIAYSIEHGPVNDKQADYSSTAYWYGTAEPSVHRTDSLRVGDPGDEQAHHYTSADPGPATTLDSVFEGDQRDPARLTAATRATHAPVTFVLAVDLGNRGVELRRTSDQKAAHQQVEVRVNGRRLPDWYQPLGNGERRWLDDTYLIPSAVTHGRKALTITLTPPAGAPDWSAASYTAYSLS